MVSLYYYHFSKQAFSNAIHNMNHVLCIVEPRLYLECVLRTVLTPQIHT